MNLRALRVNKGVSVETVAAAVGVKPATVYYWERAAGKPRDATVAKTVADYFDVRVTDIWPVEPVEPKAAA